MARPTLFLNRKFLKLSRRLGSRALALGHLELLWHVANETGNPIVGDAEDVEMAAHWEGAPGELVAALVECGAPGSGFLDQREDGLYEIHHYWHHAPQYASSRAEREDERTRERNCHGCERSFRSADPRALYCSSACRSKAYRERHRDTDGSDGRSVTNERTSVSQSEQRRGSVTDRATDRVTDERTERTVTDRHTTPAPAPAPAPAREEVDTSPGRGKGISSIKPLGGKSDLSTKNPRSPPQDARAFDVIKQNVASIAERFSTTDPDRIYALGHQSYRLSKKQCQAAVKQLREDGFFDRMKISG